jgi:D-ribose pyranose/furanose isomerase RbsD
MNFSPADITALVVAASFAAGLNIYATVLTLGILERTQWVALPPGLESLGHTWVLVVCGIMFAIEFVADKIPGFDMVWNALHTVVRVPIAALVAYHASSQLTPQMQILATAIGAVIALAAHSSKTAVRAAVTPSPEPVSNIALSTTEDVAAIGLTWFATQHPVIAASIALVCLAAAILAARALVRAIQRLLRKLFGTELEENKASAKRLS